MQLIKEKWSSDDYIEFIFYLKSISVETAKKFNDSIYNDAKKEVLGISIPTLRNIAKEILKGDSSSFIAISESKEMYVEEVMVQGFVIALKKEDIEDKFKNIDKFVPKITSWAICDTFVPSLKCVKRFKDKYLKYIEKYLDEKNEFSTRFYIISLLDYYIDDESIDYVLDKLVNIHSDYYYVKMAVAWALAEAYISYKEKVSKIIVGNKLDKFTHNKTISKICDSYRVEKVDKDYLRTLRVK